jgi:competence protein ComFB
MADVRIKNYMEDCVSDMLDTVLKDINVCDCGKCKYDITAIALNSLPPKYVVTRKGQLYTKLSSLQQQFDVDIIAAITKASVIVSRNPRHNGED